MIRAQTQVHRSSTHPMHVDHTLPREVHAHHTVPDASLYRTFLHSHNPQCFREVLCDFNSPNVFSRSTKNFPDLPRKTIKILQITTTNTTVRTQIKSHGKRMNTTISSNRFPERKTKTKTNQNKNKNCQNSAKQLTFPGALPTHQPSSPDFPTRIRSDVRARQPGRADVSGPAPAH